MHRGSVQYSILLEPMGPSSMICSFIAHGNLVMGNLRHVAVAISITFPDAPESFNAERM